VSFRLEPGQGLAIVGPSAAGKTTFAKALLGIWPWLRGDVRLDGATPDQWDPEVLGRCFGYVPQNVELLEGTIGENIARFDPDATSDKVIAAARAAGLDDLIKGMSAGYDTPVSQGGASLSAGQRQRIGLATALYGDPHLLVLGDIAYEQVTPESIKAYDASWGRFLDRTHAVVGNHEYFGNGPEVYWDYFGDRAGDRGSGWYSFDVGAWHVVVLNSECSDVDCDPDGDQLEWLKADLDGNSTRCTLAAFHRPRFSSGDEYGDDESVSGFWQVLQDAGADVVLNGHEHSYERFAPQRDSGRATAEEGMAEFVVGTGGRDLRGFGDPKPNSEVRWNDSFGVLALTLYPDHYDWRFHATDGADVDEGSAACR